MGPRDASWPLSPTTTTRPPPAHRAQRLIERDLQPCGVERDVEALAVRRLRDLGRELGGVAGVEGVVGAEFESPVEDDGIDVQGDHRDGADEPCQLHDVGTDPADAHTPTASPTRT